MCQPVSTAVGWCWLKHGPPSRISSGTLHLPQNPSMSTGESQPAQLVPAEPLAFAVRDSNHVIAYDAKDLQRDAVAGDRVFDDAERLEALRPDPESNASRPLYIGLCGRQLNIRELPQVRVDRPGGSLPDEEATVFLRDKRHKMPGGGWTTPAGVGKFRNAGL